MSNSTIQKTPTGTGKSRSNFTRTNKPNTGSTSRPKGKSKYAQKSRKPKPPVVAKRKDPVYSYTSACCGLPAVKKPCVAVGKKDALVQSLGKFRCTGCKKRAKVTVSKFKAPETFKVTSDPAVAIELAQEVANA